MSYENGTNIGNEDYCPECNQLSKEIDKLESRNAKLVEALKLALESLSEGQERFHPGFFGPDIEKIKEAIRAEAGKL